MPPGGTRRRRNQFGIHEFMRLCRLVGAEPYLAANVGSGTPQEFHDWVSYCNAPRGPLSLADERAANGDKEPFRVKYWGVGNESWGCGGNMSRRRIRHRVSQVHHAGSRSTCAPFFVATGPRGHSARRRPRLDEGFFAGCRTCAGCSSGWTASRFTTTPTSARPPKTAPRFDEKGWYAVLHKGAHIESRDRRPLGHHGQIRPAAPHQVRDRRVGQLVPAPAPSSVPTTS